jgi:glycosyltransferase involved in cell wall biosynthesis
LRLVVASPFLDRQHGTETCIVEQIERLALHYEWEVHLYSQRVEQVRGVNAVATPDKQARGSIVWHRISTVPGPHLSKYIWWLFANYFRRWRDRRSGEINTDLTYSPGINCLDADAIVVHIVFHELCSRISSELRLRQAPIRSWHLVIHRKLYYALAKILERKIYRDPRIRLVAVSNLTARHLRTYFDRTDVVVIPNAVDTSRFTPKKCLEKRDAMRQLFNYSAGDFVLLLIGNDWKNKGLGPLLRALAFLGDLPLRLLVVGVDDPRPYKPWVAKLPSQNQVRFEAPSPEVLSFYAAADAYVGPSLEDAFGLPIIEAMACGLPVIASVNAGASELIRDGETGLLLSDPRDASEIARLIQKIYADGSLRRRLGLAAAEHVQANCGWDQNVRKTAEFLKAVARDRQKG